MAYSGRNMTNVAAKHLGLIEFIKFLKLQDWMWNKRVLGEIGDIILFAEHPPVISLGSRRREEQNRHILVAPEFLRTRGIPVIQTERGGSVTIHCPGILGCYIIADISGLEFSTEFIYRLEYWVQKSLEMLGIDTKRLPPEFRKVETAKYEGLWIGCKKIASVGIKISRHITRFGININISPKEYMLRMVNPCGIEEYEFSSLAQEGFMINTRDVISGLENNMDILFRNIKKNLAQ
ncbi:MAG: lipoyl(octanoyl) transferase LipB [Candidatus Sungbacteria bacterium]|nr:lipoyl(octanoyl) transferase LipB [Candidatus Sungbacteria bacterium]